MVAFRWGAESITGNYRENNEDAYFVHPEGYYFLVADGMGGQSAGERASEMAVELIPQKLNAALDFVGGRTPDPVKVIDDAVAYANSEIMALSQLDPDCRNMGTTIAFLIRCGNRCFVGGVGDSRVYLLRGDQLKQLTKDHSLTQALVDAKTITEEQAVNHRYRNVLYRYLGTKEGGKGTTPVEISPQPGDRFLLCSDGVTDGLKNEQLRTLLQQHSDPEQAARAIVRAAEQGGSTDNITCIVVFVE